MGSSPQQADSQPAVFCPSPRTPLLPIPLKERSNQQLFPQPADFFGRGGGPPRVAKKDPVVKIGSALLSNPGNNDGGQTLIPFSSCFSAFFLGRHYHAAQELKAKALTDILVNAPAGVISTFCLFSLSHFYSKSSRIRRGDSFEFEPTNSNIVC